MYGDCVWAWGGALAYGAEKSMKIRGMVVECEPADFAFLAILGEGAWVWGPPECVGSQVT